MEFGVDMNEVYSAPKWLLYNLESTNQDKVHTIYTVLYGIWFWRNKRAWEGREVTAQLVM